MEIIVIDKEYNSFTNEITYSFDVTNVPDKPADIEDDAGYSEIYGPVYVTWEGVENSEQPQLIVSVGQEVNVSAVAWSDYVIKLPEGDEEYYTKQLCDPVYFSEIAKPDEEPEPPITPDEPEFEHPGTFDLFNFAPNVMIESEDGLTAEKVDRWCDHCEKYLSWVSQTDMAGAADNCRVNSGDFITASWYNKCADLCGASHVAQNDLITAELFKALGAAISGE